MHIIDITAELSERSKMYQGDPAISMAAHASIASEGYCVTRLEMGSHSGTHVDAPCHYVEGGDTVIQIPLGMMVGKCFVLDASDMRVPPRARRVLISGFSEADHTLNARQARAIADAGIVLVGTDSMSIGDDEVHRLLLKAGVVILESLDLSRVKPGPYFLCALPLKVACDGAPVRACLIDQYKQ